MKKGIYLLIIFASFWFSSCTSLDLAPMNVIQDKDVFTSSGGIDVYMARLYSEMPIEDFRYSPTRGYNMFWIISPPPANTGEALSRDLTGATSETFGWWSDAYKIIRDADYFIETLPQYSKYFSTAQVNNWLGEARFVRDFTYFELAKRYGGVPLVDKVLQYPGQTLEQLNIPRSSEEKVYDFIAADLDTAIVNMNETSVSGRANKYVAAALKSRAMLFAGSIAKYNQISLFDGSKNRLCGIPAARAVDYFKASYNASKLLDGKYSLYNKAGNGDKTALYQNYINLFFDSSSPENILVKGYLYPSSVHGYDAYNVPRQSMGANGYSSEVNPTLNYIELFDGLPKNADGTLSTLGPDGKYTLYKNTMDLFANAEPRLRATVILPGDAFKGENIEIRRGIYTGDASNGISPLLPPGSASNYPTTNLIYSANGSQTPYSLPDGTKMNPAGLSGIFTSDGTCAISGFSIRKYLNPDMPKSSVLENHSDQTWIEMRYAEVLLNRAEAAYELSSLGQSDQNYLSDAYNCINQIRTRAGADLLQSVGDLNSVNVIRKERRKELGFENKIWWDLKRWRIADTEMNGTVYRVLMPFYSSNAGKYFFDARTDERNCRYTFDPRWYYEQIPSGEITKSPSLIQNPGY